MPIPSPCKPIANQLAKLTADEQTKRKSLASLAGVAKWKAMEDLGTLRQQMAEQQVLLDGCEKQHAADLSTEIAIIDMPGTSGPNRIARVWQLTSTDQIAKQAVSVTGGTATLSGIVGSARQSFGITIEQIDQPSINGPDFRSGPLPPLPQGAAKDLAERIEIVILDPIDIGADTLGQAAPSLPIQLSFPTGPTGIVNISVTVMQFAITKTQISLSASGTASAFGVASPFTFDDALHVAPTFNMARSKLLEILVGDPPSLSMTGLVGNLVQQIAPFLSSHLLELTLQALTLVLTKAISDRVTTKLGLSSLPPGSVLSVRQLSTDNGKITITPTLAAFGTALSDFQPSAPGFVCSLSKLEVRPTTISTSDPVNRIAQGTVSLGKPAPAAGVSITLSCDRNDLVQIVPVSLPISAGATSGSFEVRGIAQSLITSSQRDCTIRAILDDQSLTTIISVQPDAPLQAAPSPAPIVLPVVSAASIAKIELLNPPPGVVHANLYLDKLADQDEAIYLTFTPPVRGPMNINVWKGDLKAHFAFMVSGQPTAIRLKAVMKSGSTKEVDIPLAT